MTFSPTFVLARPVRAGASAIVVIQDAAFDGTRGLGQGISHEDSSEAGYPKGLGCLLQLDIRKGLFGNAETVHAYFAHLFGDPIVAVGKGADAVGKDMPLIVLR